MGSTAGQGAGNKSLESIFSNPLAWAHTVHQIENQVVLLPSFDPWAATITQGNNKQE